MYHKRADFHIESITKTELKCWSVYSLSVHNSSWPNSYLFFIQENYSSNQAKNFAELIWLLFTYYIQLQHI